MLRDPRQAALNQFALVIYIPGPLGAFLDQLSLELAPGCSPHAHVSVLPPRPLPAPWTRVLEEAQAITAGFAPFEIEATETRIFPATDVVYLDIGRGGPQLHRMHALLDRNSLAHTEAFPYHPHITLAQGIAGDRVGETLAKARRLWQEYRGPRTFQAENAIFVKNAAVDRWLDVATVSFGSV